MLVLGRKENESIIIGDQIRVTIVGRSGSSIRVGVEAPDHVRIVREELTGRGKDGSQSAGPHVVIGSIGTAPLPRQAG